MAHNPMSLATQIYNWQLIDVLLSIAIGIILLPVVVDIVRTLVRDWGDTDAARAADLAGIPIWRRLLWLSGGVTASIIFLAMYSIPDASPGLADETGIIIATDTSGSTGTELTGLTPFDSAMASLGDGRYEDANDFFDSALSKPETADSAKAQIYYYKGFASQMQNDHMAAVESYDLALAVRPEYAEVWLNKAIALLKLQRFDEAYASLNTAQEFAKSHTLWYFFGMLWLDLRHYPDALAHLDSAIEIHPKYAEAWCGRGIVLNRLCRLEEALASLDSATTFGQTYAPAHSEKGIIFAKFKNLMSSLASLDTARSVQISPIDAWVKQGEAYLAFDDSSFYQNALVMLDSAIFVDSANSKAWYYRGVVFSKRQKFPEALNSVNRALRSKPDYVDAKYEKAYILYQLGDEDATLALDRAFEMEAALNPASAWLHRGMAFNRRRSLDSAIVALDTALDFCGEYPELSLKVAKGLWAVNQRKKALRAVELALTHNPEWPEALTLRDSILEQTGS